MFIGNGIKILVQEYTLDQDYSHFLLLVLVPPLFAVSLVSPASMLCLLLTSLMLSAVLHPSTRPESFDDNRSHRTLP